MSTLKAGTLIYMPFVIGATELSAGTAIELVAPEAGYIVGLQSTVQTAIVTGGTLDVKTGSALATTVAGLQQTIANGSAVGTRQSTEATAGSSTRVVAAGDRVAVVPSAAFNGGGAMAGYVVFASANVSPATPQ